MKRKTYDMPYNNEKTSSYKEYEQAWRDYFLFQAKQDYLKNINLYWNDGNSKALQHARENEEKEIKEHFDFYYNKWKDKA